MSKIFDWCHTSASHVEIDEGLHVFLLTWAVIGLADIKRYMMKQSVCLQKIVETVRLEKDVETWGSHHVVFSIVNLSPRV